LRSHQPRWERFPHLQLEVDLTPAEYLLIGARTDQVGARTDQAASLGRTLFGPVTAPTSTDRQWRLLLLRVRSSMAASGADLPPIPSPYLRR
jgi:hypothetical protein